MEWQWVVFATIYGFTYVAAGAFISYIAVREENWDRERDGNGWSIFFCWLPLLGWMLFNMMIQPYPSLEEGDDTSEGD